MKAGADYWDALWAGRRGVGGAEFPFRLFCVDLIEAKIFNQNSVFLDIGCGDGATSRLLEDLGMRVIAVDISSQVRAHVHCDIRDFDCDAGSLDCVVDLNTMCCLENPPYENIHRWLKPGGVLYSMYPTYKHDSGDKLAFDVKSDRDYCRMPTFDEMAGLMSGYDYVTIREYFRPMGRTQYISSWCVEGWKDRA
jgi:SAM-dependent methyltransferase